jgi:hypothetical protein
MFKPDELALADKIELLKNQRLFAQTIRDGIRLVCDLRAGRLDVLYELHPLLRERIEQQSPAAPISNGGLRPMNVSSVAAPIEDDEDDLDGVIKRNTSTQSAANFLKSLSNLVDS